MSLLAPNDFVLDNVVILNPGVRPEQTKDFYLNAIKNLQPGLTEMIVHLGHDDAELQAVMVDHPDYGAAWRQRDFDIVSSSEFKKALQDNHVILVHWKDLQKVLNQKITFQWSQLVASCAVRLMAKLEIPMITLPQLRIILPLLALSLFISAPALCQAGAPTSADLNCGRLAQLKLPAATITLAKLVPAGTFSGPPALYSGLDLTPFYKTLPTFCRAVAQATPTPDSDIKLEVWMPASGWNGKLQGIGNGGFAGQIDYAQLGTAVLHGYAATATDTGHVGAPTEAAWALGHPEKVIDFGHRGVHEMTRIARATVNGFYGRNPERSYFWGCSDGGREALMEAQRYPEDYDGILAGAPANYWTALVSAGVWNTQALTLDPASFIPPAMIPALANAVLAACDSLDNVRDGVLNDPRQCQFDPTSILCKQGEESDKCLTTGSSGGTEEAVPGSAGLSWSQHVSRLSARR